MQKCYTSFSPIPALCALPSVTAPITGVHSSAPCCPIYSALPYPPNPIHYIILNNGILKSNSSVFPRSEGYITQYTP